MKQSKITLIFTALGVASMLPLAGCATNTKGSANAYVPMTGGTATVKMLGDARVTTRRLINRPLTNKDIGKVYEEITVESPRGKSVQHRVIVRALPTLETMNVTKT